MAPHRVRHPDKKYNGVSPHRDAWLATIKIHARVITIGRFKDILDAAWAADFARYMAYGVDVRQWYDINPKRPPHPPNFAPVYNSHSERQLILRKLFVRGLLDATTMAKRLAEYDAVAEAVLKKSV